MSGALIDGRSCVVVPDGKLMAPVLCLRSRKKFGIVVPISTTPKSELYAAYTRIVTAIGTRTLLAPGSFTSAISGVWVGRN